MAVRPPSGDSSEPETIEFGIAAVDARLDGADLSFPATPEEILAALEDPEIPYDASGNRMALSDAFDRLPVQEFDNETELLEALHPIFEERRTSGGSGFVSRLRALLPF